MAQNTNYNEPFYWHRIVNVGWGGMVGVIEIIRPLTDFIAAAIETVSPGEAPGVSIGQSVGFDNPFKVKEAFDFGSGSEWPDYFIVDLEDEGNVLPEFLVSEEYTEIIVNNIASTTSEDPAVILHQNDFADDLVGPGNWYSIHYVGPTTTIPTHSSPDGDFWETGPLTIWYTDVPFFHPAVSEPRHRHAWLVNFRKSKVVEVRVDTTIPKGQEIEWTVKIFPETAELVQGDDGSINRTDEVAPVRQFSGGPVSDATTGGVFKFNSLGFVS